MNRYKGHSVGWRMGREKLLPLAPLKYSRNAILQVAVWNLSGYAISSLAPYYFSMDAKTTCKAFRFAWKDLQNREEEEYIRCTINFLQHKPIILRVSTLSRNSVSGFVVTPVLKVSSLFPTTNTELLVRLCDENFEDDKKGIWW